MFDATEVMASALSASRLRVNTIASNIANAETTRTPEGGPYKRRDVVQTAISMPAEFSNILDRMSMAKPQAAAVVEDSSPPRRVFQPGHPDADTEGYVAYPNINVVTAMTDLMAASRAYQAGVTTIETTRRMSQDAQQIATKY
jgi:flagellar basal-body rod protein FlgC